MLVVVLLNGGPIDVSWMQNADRVGAILTAWFPGQVRWEEWGGGGGGVLCLCVWWWGGDGGWSPSRQHRHAGIAWASVGCVGHELLLTCVQPAAPLLHAPAWWRSVLLRLVPCCSSLLLRKSANPMASAVQLPTHPNTHP